MPLVSVNILTHNRAELFKKALLSVKAQSFKDYEVVVGNNYSTDNTRNVVEDLKKQGINIVHLYHDPEISITANRQSTLDASSGKYIATLDDDDQWCDAEKLKKQVEFLENRPEVVIVGGGINRVDDNAKFVDIKLRPETDEQIRKTILLKNNFFTSTAMFRRDAAKAAGGFEFFENDYAEDYYFWLRLGLKGKMHNLQEIFTDYRIPNYSKAKARGFILKQSHLIEKFKDKYPRYLLAKILLQLRLVIYKVI